MVDGPMPQDSYGHERSSRRKTLALSQYFTDRQSESIAFMHSVWARDRHLTDDSVTPAMLENVLLFYGFSGLGKSQLSLGLQLWIDSQAADGIKALPSHWGAPPAPDRPVVTARWDLNDSGGNLDPVPLLLSIRAALHNKRNNKKLPTKTWRAFDIAFAAYVSRVRPGQPLDPTEDSNGYARELPQMIGEIALDTVVDVGAGVGAKGLNDLVHGALRVIRRKKAVGEYAQLPALIEECFNAEPGNLNGELASDILFLIDYAIKRLEPAERPLIIVFVDHLERVQGDTRVTRNGERLLNQLVAALPHALFVMTGHNFLDWFDAKRTGLAHSGARQWPCLQIDTRLRPDNPRPHLLKTLSEDDAREWIGRQARELDLPFAPGLVDNLVTVTGRWPVHIDAVFDLARVKVDDGLTLLTVEHLDGSFDDVVQRLLEDLPSDERHALQAASLLPYFDIPFVASITGEGVNHGTIERLVRRAIVLENYGSRYAYRIHDEVRRAIRAAGPRITGGWAQADWQANAELALRHACDATKLARSERNDDANLAATGLAITLAAEYGLTAKDIDEPEIDELVRAWRGSPSHGGLLQWIPSSDQVRESDARALIRLTEIVAGPTDDEAVTNLAELATVPSTSMTDALVWRGYRLRSLRRYTEAADQFRWLRDNAPDRSINSRRRLYARQIGTSYSLGRRFRDAADAMPFMDADQSEINRLVDLAHHGHLDQPYFDNLVSRIKDANPRYAIELTASLHQQLARIGMLNRVKADEFLAHAVRFGHRTAERGVAAARAIDDIARGLNFRTEGIDVFHTADATSELGEVLAFKALRDGVNDELMEWISCARDRGTRGRAYIPVEFLLEELGHPLPPVETQWLEPVTAVRDRWLGHYRALLEV